MVKNAKSALNLDTNFLVHLLFNMDHKVINRSREKNDQEAVVIDQVLLFLITINIFLGDGWCLKFKHFIVFSLFHIHLGEPSNLFFYFFFHAYKLAFVYLLQILAMVIGGVPVLKRLIFTSDAPLYFFTDSFIILGYVLHSLMKISCFLFCS